jgi:hypothetical protein
MNYDRKSEVGSELELRLEEAALRIRGRELASVVEPGLANGDRFRVRQQLAKLVEPGGVGGSCLMRVDTEHREHAVVSLGKRERSS